MAGHGDSIGSATAMVDTGSATDEVILEELEGTATMELRLRRDFADDRLHPPVDPVRSGTRREDLLLGEQEQQIVWKLRTLIADRVVEQGSDRAGMELLLQRLSTAPSNIELLTRVQKSS
jgi:transcription termination factor Rho